MDLSISDLSPKSQNVPKIPKNALRLVIGPTSGAEQPEQPQPSIVLPEFFTDRLCASAEVRWGQTLVPLSNRLLLVVVLASQFLTPDVRAEGSFVVQHNVSFGDRSNVCPFLDGCPLS
jgi:hypothetical protein